MRHLILVILALGLLLAPSMSAQSALNHISGPAQSRLFAAAVPDSTPKAIPPTHWQRGMLIGGAVGAVGLGGLVYGFCESLRETQSSCVGPGLGGAALGAVTGGIVGALIGGAFPKRAPAPPDSIAPTP